MEAPRIIRDSEVFSERFIPPRLIVRSREAEFLTRKLLLRLSDRLAGPEIVAIFGAPGRSAGIGKTTLAKYVAGRVSEILRGRGMTVVPVYVNTYPAPTLFEILKMIASQLSSAINIKGGSTFDGLKAIVDYLYYKDMFAIVILDEFQSLIKSPKVDDAYLYSLLRVYEQVPAPDGVQRISFILVASDYLELSRLRQRMPQIDSQITLRLKLEPYTREELYQILLQRAELGLEPGTWDDSILMQIADYFGYDEYRIDGIHDGNARRAINALRTAAEIAMMEGSPRITEEHVRTAISSDTIPTFDVSDIYGLSIHELLVLLAVARHARRMGGYATTGKLRKMYEELCELYGLRPRGHTQFNQYINELARIGLIVAKPSGKGMRGRTTLITLPNDIPAKPLIEVVEKVLRDKLEAEGARSDYRGLV